MSKGEKYCSHICKCAVQLLPTSLNASFQKIKLQKVSSRGIVRYLFTVQGYFSSFLVGKQGLFSVHQIDFQTLPAELFMHSRKKWKASLETPAEPAVFS